MAFVIRIILPTREECAAMGISEEQREAILSEIERRIREKDLPHELVGSSIECRLIRGVDLGERGSP